MTFAKESYILHIYNNRILSWIILLSFYTNNILKMLQIFLRTCFKYDKYALSRAILRRKYCYPASVFSLSNAKFTNSSLIATRCVVPSGSPNSKSPISEVGLSESSSHQKVPPQKLCFICTFIALFELWGL